MPIVDPNAAGPKRYAVFTFVQDEKPGCPTSPAQRFPMSPHASSFEASTRLKQSELFHMKRLKSLEKHVSYPFVDVTFFSSYQKANDMKNLLEPSDCINLHDHTILLQKGCFEEVQLVDPKRDMILTPIDSDDPLTERMTGRGVTTENKIPYDTPEERAEDYKLTRGYIIIAYKTMEHMYSRDFVSSWKTWTGVRYICMQLPRQLGLRRIAFYRQISTTSDFTYVLVIEIINLLVYSAQTLNLMDSIKLRLCGYTGIFRECDFQVDLATAAVHKIETTYRPPPTYKQISGGSMKNNASQNKGSRRSSSESQYKLLEPVGEDAENEKDENAANTISASNDVQVLTEMFRKKTEIANKRRKEQEIAVKLDEKRKTKLFKLYRGRSSIPDYAPPPPPSDFYRDDDYGNSNWLNDNDFIRAPKAVPESPDSFADSAENVDVTKENQTPLEPQQQQPVEQHTVQNENVNIDVHRQHQTDESGGSASLTMPAQSPFRSPVVERRAKSPSTPKTLDAKGQPTLLEARSVLPLASVLITECKRNSAELTSIAVVPNSYRRTSLSPAAASQNKSIQNNNDENVSTTATGRKYLLAIEDGRRLSSSFTDVAPSATRSTTGRVNSDEFFNSPIYTRTEWRTNHVINDPDQNDSDEQDSGSHRSLKSLSKELAGVLLNTGGGTAGESRSSSHRRSMRVKTMPSHRSGVCGSGSSHSLSSDAFVGQSLAARRQAYFTLLEQSRNASKERFGIEGGSSRRSADEMGAAEAAPQHRQSMPGFAHDRSGSMGGPDHKEYENMQLKGRRGRSKNYMISDEIEALLEIPMSRRCLIPAPIAAAASRSVSPHSRQPILALRSIAGGGNGSSSNHSSSGSITVEKSIPTQQHKEKESDQQQQKVIDETSIKTITDIPRIDGGNLGVSLIVVETVDPYEASLLSVTDYRRPEVPSKSKKSRTTAQRPSSTSPRPSRFAEQQQQQRTQHVSRGGAQFLRSSDLSGASSSRSSSSRSPDVRASKSPTTIAKKSSTAAAPAKGVSFGDDLTKTAKSTTVAARTKFSRK